MPVTKVVRIIRTYDIPVQPEYGDTEDGVVARADVADAAFVEQRLILPDFVAEDVIVAADAAQDLAQAADPVFADDEEVDA